MSVRVRRGIEPMPSLSSVVREPFSAFYERELPRQVRRATLLLGSPEAAHDAVHDAFVAVFRHWDELQSGGPYLDRAVLNRCRDVGRQASSRAPDPAPEHVGARDRRAAVDALSKLPFNHRAAVVLRYYHQLTEFEIAELLHCRPGSVGPWIRRGLETLRRELS